MAWRDEMQKASFRGVEFHVRSSNGTIGRRNVVHEYPERDDPYVQDLGRRAREFTLDAFLIGPDYFAARNRLEEAIEAEGPGELVHPWRGRMTVSVIDCRPSESIEAGGMIRYSITFTQSGKNVSPGARADTPSLVSSAADNAIAAIADDFSEKFTVEALPEFVEQDAAQTINGVLDEMLAISRGMLPDMSLLPEFNLAASTTAGKISQLLRLVPDLANSLTSQISALFGIASGPGAAFRALTNLFDFGDDETSPPRTTPSRTQLADNRQAVHDLTQRTAVVEAARASSQIEFESYDEAVQVRDQVTDALEAEALTAPDPIYRALTDLRVAVVRDINTRGANLARIVNWTPRSTTPALVVAHQIYGDATRDAEIVARNNIPHPGFVQGGQALEVLSDD